MTQPTATAAAPDLTPMLAAVKARGLAGIALIHQGGTASPYLAMCLDCNGEFADPRNYHPQPTPEAALSDLAARLERGGVR